MEDRWAEHYARRIRPIAGSYYKYVLSLGGGNKKAIHQPRWRGIRVCKFPSDLILYAEAIWANRPDFIIETGTRFGGSAAFFGDMLSLSGGTRVFTIDIKDQLEFEHHPMVEFIKGSSTDPKVVDYISDQIDSCGSVMASLDSSHETPHVREELKIYAPIVTNGQYMVVEDCKAYGDEIRGPHAAVVEFLKDNPDYEQRFPETKYIFSVMREGWLLKKSA